MTNRITVSKPIPAVFAGAIFSVLATASHALPQPEFITDWQNAISDKIINAVDEATLGVTEMKTQQKIVITNSHNEKRTAMWTAAGCAGIKEGVTLVCHSEDIGPGQSREYTYKQGTSQRKVTIHDDNRKKSKESRCDASTDVNTQDAYVYRDKGNVDGAQMDMGCRSGRRIALGQQTVAGTFMQIESKRDVAVTVIAGWGTCTGSVDGLKNTCGSITIPPRGTVSFSFKALTGSGNRVPKQVADGQGLISWTDGKLYSKPVSIDGRVRMTIPATGDTASFSK
jgi:hypothetical protein